MKRDWKLLVPNWSHLDEIWRSAKPFCLWPIGSQPFIAHWMDYAVSSGVERVDFFVSDRPTEVRKFLKDGSYWSRRISITSISSDEAAPEDAIPLLGLPHDNKIHGSLDSPADLQTHWLSLNLIWLDRIDEHEFHIEIQQSHQGWAGPQSRISPKATLTPLLDPRQMRHSRWRPNWAQRLHRRKHDYRQQRYRSKLDRPARHLSRPQYQSGSGCC